MKKTLSGMTLIEILVSIAIFSMLLSLMFYIFSISTKSWIKARNTVDIKDSAQILIERIENDIRASSPDSVEIIDFPNVSDPDNQSNAISFLSAYDDDGSIPKYSILGQINWKKFIIFYLRQDPGITASGYYQLLSKKVFLGNKDIFSTCVLKDLCYPPDSNSTTTYPIARYIDPNTPSDKYLTPGRIITGNIRQLNFIFDSSSKKINIIVKIGKPVKPYETSGEESPEKYTLQSTVMLRNK